MGDMETQIAGDTQTVFDEGVFSGAERDLFTFANFISAIRCCH